MKYLMLIISLSMISLVSHAANELSSMNTLAANLPVEERVAPQKDTSKEQAFLLDLWKTLDADLDGAISKKEVAAAKESESVTEVIDNWAKLDTNQDEKINTEEFSNYFTSK